MANITVIGGGITGITTAYALLGKGHQVTVLDTHRYAGMETSFANGGQLSASNAEAWNSWGTLFRGLRWMMNSSAPLLLSLKPSWHKYSWLAEFCAQTRNYRGNTVDTVKLAIAARDHLFEIARKEAIDFDHLGRGIMHLCYDAGSFRSGLKLNQLLAEGGLERVPLTPSQMIEIEPALRGTFYGGFYTASDSTGDIHKFTRGLADACARRGAAFLYDSSVRTAQAHQNGVMLLLDNPSKKRIDCDSVVICAGVGSRSLAAQLGDRINVYPVKGYSITVGLGDEKSRSAAPEVSLTDEAAKIVTSRLGPDRLRVAGMAEFNGVDRDIRHDRIAQLIKWCRPLFPDMATDQITHWTGLRPMSPSMMPYVTRGKRPNVYYNTGHGHLGWTLAAATAEIIAAQINADFE